MSKNWTDCQTDRQIEPHSLREILQVFGQMEITTQLICSYFPLSTPQKTNKYAQITHCEDTEADEGKSILLDDSSSSLLGNTWGSYLISTLDPTFELKVR